MHCDVLIDIICFRVNELNFIDIICFRVYELNFIVNLLTM
jgi:hypothetical protein